MDSKQQALRDDIATGGAVKFPLKRTWHRPGDADVGPSHHDTDA